MKRLAASTLVLALALCATPLSAERVRVDLARGPIPIDGPPPIAPADAEAPQAAPAEPAVNAGEAAPARGEAVQAPPPGNAPAAPPAPAMAAQEKPAEEKPAEPARERDVGARDTDSKDTDAKDTAESDPKAKDAPVKDVQASDAKSEVEQPYRLVRTLETVQDRLAEGNNIAQGFQRRFIAEIANKMLAAGDDVWQEPRNSRSALVYVLSGGDPRVIKKLLTYKELPDMPPALLKGVLAYSEGHNREALKQLSQIDHRELELRLGGHVALAKAMTTAPQDAAKALTFLDDARLMCPGTLVEEAALRRQVLLLANTGDFQRLELLAFQYLRRFARSIYARNFHRSFAITVASGKYGADPALMKRLETRLDQLPQDVRKAIYMALAEEGVIRGRVELTRLAADKIGDLFRLGTRDSARLQLYKAAAIVVTPDYETALAQLRAVDRTKLSSSDLGLLTSALSMAQEMRQPPNVPTPVRELPPLSSATQVKHGAVTEKSEALDGARAALSQADTLLNKERR